MLGAAVPSPFDVLGVSPGADEEAIERAYRQRVKATHPDQGGSADEFRRVREAYEELRSSDRLADPSGDRERQEAARIEYLNYEALDDHGWRIDDPGLFEKASRANLDHDDYGRIVVESGETILEAAENRGFTWPFSCRGGACANCAIAVVEGDMAMDVDTVLSSDLLRRDIRLSCIGRPVTDDMKIVYNVKHLPDLEELRLPSRPWAGSDD